MWILSINIYQVRNYTGTTIPESKPALLTETKYAYTPNPSHSTLGHIYQRNHRVGSQEDMLL